MLAPRPPARPRGARRAPRCGCGGVLCWGTSAHAVRLRAAETGPRLPSPGRRLWPASALACRLRGPALHIHKLHFRRRQRRVGAPTRVSVAAETPVCRAALPAASPHERSGPAAGGAGAAAAAATPPMARTTLKALTRIQNPDAPARGPRNGGAWLLHSRGARAGCGAPPAGFCFGGPRMAFTGWPCRRLGPFGRASFFRTQFACTSSGRVRGTLRGAPKRPLGNPEAPAARRAPRAPPRPTARHGGHWASAAGLCGWMCRRGVEGARCLPAVRHADVAGKRGVGGEAAPAVHARPAAGGLSLPHTASFHRPIRTNQSVYVRPCGPLAAPASPVRPAPTSCSTRPLAKAAGPRRGPNFD
jgi:hypothetical protein